MKCSLLKLVNNMHELALCQAVIDTARRTVAEHGAEGVSRIDLLVGPLSGAEVPLLERAFSVARAGTVAANSQLVCETAPVTVQCRVCSETSPAKANALLCASCGSWQVNVTSGDELLVKSMELTGLDS